MNSLHVSLHLFIKFVTIELKSFNKKFFLFYKSNLNSKKMKHLSVLFLALLPLGLLGQNIAAIKSADEFWRIQTRYKGTIRNILKEKNIQGSPYLNAAFQTGEILTKKNIRYISIPVRYNIYSDNIEFKKPDQQIMELADPSVIREVKMGKVTFVYSPYLSNKKKQYGFFQLLNSGSAEGLIRYSIQFLPATPPGAYKSAQPARFSPTETQLYVRFGEDPAVKVSKNSDFMRALPDKKAVVSKFIKKERIRAGREKDLLKLLNYYNSL
jgi:hypothetical protein